MPTIPTYNNTPALRFPEFRNDGEWEEKKLGELIEEVKETVNNHITIPLYSLTIEDGITSKTERYERGFLVTKKDNAFKVVFPNDFVSNPMNLRFGAVGYNQNPFKVCVSGYYDVFRFKETGVTVFWNNYLKSELLLHKYDEIAIGSLLEKRRVYFSNLQNLRLLVPSLPEQRKIADYLSSMDELISSTNSKLEQLKKHKKALMQKLFPIKGKKLPELRFKEFEKDGKWEEKKLGEVTQCINRRNKSNRALPIYSISNTDGFIPQSEQFAGLDSGSRGYDISLYKIVGKHTFAYNPARINVGSIGYSGDLKDVLISSLYVCFKTSDEMDDSFLMYFFSTSMFKQTVENNVEGGIRSCLFYENFSKIKIAYPTLNEQKKIALCLSSTDDLINTYTNKLLLLQTYKTGLMQQLFP